MTVRRVLLVNYEYPPVGGGGGNASYHIARCMAAEGVEPFVLTAAQGTLPRVEYVDGVTVRRIPAFRQRADRCSIPEMVAYIAAGCLNGPGLARVWRPDVSLAFHAIPSGAVSWFLKQTNNLPYAVSLQGGDVPGFDPGRLAKWHKIAGSSLRRIWADAGITTAISEGLAERARPHAGGTEIGVIPVGADVDGIAAKDSYAPGEAVKLLFVGRFVSQKALDILIPALAQVPAELAWKLILVGDGPQRGALVEAATRLGIIDRIEFRGWVPKTAVAAIYRDADVFVLPSRDESMPNALLEAMAAGLPVISTRVTGPLEQVVAGKTGLLVPPEDVASLGEAITALVRDAALRESMGRAGRARAETDYSWRAVTKTWIGALSDVVAQSKSGAKSGAKSAAKSARA